MIIIDKTKPSAPILEYKPKPQFKSDTEKQKYWEGEKKKWTEGYLDIPSTLYHKTQEQWIKDRDNGAIFRPECRDVDLLIHQKIAECRKIGKALLLVKGRGLGLSTEFGCLANYFAKVHIGTSSLMTSQENAKILSLFRDKVLLTYDKYDKEIQPVEKNRTTNKGNCGLVTEQLYRNKDGELEVNLSQIICRETSDSISSASAFSGTGAIFGAYDELFLHKRRAELVRSSTSCFTNSRTQEISGFLFAGGTVEDTLNNQQLFDLQEMIVKVKKTGMLEAMPCDYLFIPSWMGKHTVNGWSDEKKAKEIWNKNIEALEKNDDADALRAYRMNNPMEEDDIFQLTSGSRFSDTISDKIKIQIKTVRNENPPVMKCNLVEVGGVVQTIDSRKPNMHILEHPKRNIEYYQFIDGVGIGKEQGNEKGASLIASLTMKMFDPEGGSYSPVALYFEKPDVVPDSYPKLISQIKYYNKFDCFKGVTWEHAQGLTDHIAAHLKNEGLGKHIMNRRDTSGKGYIDEKKYGQPITIEARKYQYREAHRFLDKYLQNTKMLLLLEQMLLPMEKNADILDAWLLMFSAMKTDFDKIVVKKEKPPRQRMEYYREGFVTKTRWVAV